MCGAPLSPVWQSYRHCLRGWAPQRVTEYEETEQEMCYNIGWPLSDENASRGGCYVYSM